MVCSRNKISNLIRMVFVHRTTMQLTQISFFVRHFETLKNMVELRIQRRSIIYYDVQQDIDFYFGNYLTSTIYKKKVHTQYFLVAYPVSSSPT